LTLLVSVQITEVAEETNGSVKCERSNYDLQEMQEIQSGFPVAVADGKGVANGCRRGGPPMR